MFRFLGSSLIIVSVSGTSLRDKVKAFSLIRDYPNVPLFHLRAIAEHEEPTLPLQAIDEALAQISQLTCVPTLFSNHVRLNLHCSCSMRSGNTLESTTANLSETS